MTSLPTAPLAIAGLLGGYTLARRTGNRPLGGAVLGAAGLAAGSTWARRDGAATTAALAAIYLGGFGASHPLSKKIGPWPAVLSVTAVSAAAAYVLSDRRH